jgi:hypothetical protein
MINTHSTRYLDSSKERGPIALKVLKNTDDFCMMYFQRFQGISVNGEKSNYSQGGF